MKKNKLRRELNVDQLTPSFKLNKESCQDDRIEKEDEKISSTLSCEVVNKD